MDMVNLHYIPQEFVGCGEWVEPWGTLQQQEEGNSGTGEEGNPESRRGVALRGRRRVPLGGCSRIGCRARGSSVKPYTWGRYRWDDYFINCVVLKNVSV